MALTMNRKRINEIDSPKKFISDGHLKDCIRERTQIFKPISTNSNFIDSTNILDFTDLKMAKKFMYEYREWRAIKKIMDIFNKSDKSLETLQLVKEKQKITKHENLQLIFDNKPNRKVWLPRRPDRRGRNKVASIDLELIFRNNLKNRCNGGD